MTVRTRVVWWIVAGCLLTLVAVLLDPWAYQHVVWARVYETDWGRLLRMMGYWPTWAIVALALWRDGTPRTIATWRAKLLIAAVTGVGLFGELLKLLVRRERPNAHDGVSVFRPFDVHPLSSAGLSTPSSHALLAFAAAATLARLFPKTAWLWYALAVGCAVTRLLARAHFLSDVVIGALLGVASAYITEAVIRMPSSAVKEHLIPVDVT